MVNIVDVARRAGVSTATVSRVLSNPEVVSEATRAKVMTAVEAMNYVPSSAPKVLRTQRTMKIIVTMPTIANPYFSSVVRGVESEASAQGYALLIGDTHNTIEREARHAEMVLRREVDGLIFLGHAAPPLLAGLIERGGGCAPVVSGCELSPQAGVSSAHIDNAAAGAEVFAYLHGLGHRRIGVVAGAEDSPISHGRLDGVLSSARALGGADRLAISHTNFSVEGGARAGAELLALEERPTALLCFGDELAIGALSAVKAAGLRCPDDISVTGFDGARFAPYLDPPLTTIEQPMDEIGRECARLLLDILAGRITEVQDIVLEHRLVIRESCAPPKA